MENVNWLSMIIATLIPSVVGFLWYHKALFGNCLDGFYWYGPMKK